MTIKQNDARPDPENRGQNEHHPRLKLDEAIHQPVRLSIMAILAQSKRVDFAFLRNYLELSDSNLSRHLTALEGLGYIVIDKVFEKKRPRTWLSLSPEGRAAFENHVRLLQQIVQQPLVNDEVAELPTREEVQTS